jgi:hypothetical protein
MYRYRPGHDRWPIVNRLFEMNPIDASTDCSLF